MTETWDPTMPVDKAKSSLRDILICVGFGSADSDGVGRIRDKLDERGVHTPEQLERWSKGELLSTFAALKLKEKPRYYLQIIGKAIGFEWQGMGDDKKEYGGNMSQKSTKVDDTQVNWRMEEPDARVYQGLPRLGETKALDQDQQNYVTDAVTLAGHIHPSEAIGDYMPDRYPLRLANIHQKLLPPFPGEMGKDLHSSAKVYKHRAQNGRFMKYKRIVLDEKFKMEIQAREPRPHASPVCVTTPVHSPLVACVCAQPKTRAHIKFVPSDAMELLDNPLNDLVTDLVAIRDGKKEATKLVYPDQTEEKENTKPEVEAKEKPECGLAEDELAEGELAHVDVNAGQPDLPKAKANKASTSASSKASSKQDELKKRKEQGKGAKGKAPKKPMPKDSSDEDSSEDDMPLSKRQATGNRPKPAPKPPAPKPPSPEPPAPEPPRPKKQTKLKLKFAPGPVKDGDEVLLKQSVEPALDPANGAGRFLMLKREACKSWDKGDGTAAWIGKIMKSSAGGRGATPSFQIKFSDATLSLNLEFLVEHAILLS